MIYCDHRTNERKMRHGFSSLISCPEYPAEPLCCRKGVIMMEILAAIGGWLLLTAAGTIQNMIAWVPTFVVSYLIIRKIEEHRRK